MKKVLISLMLMMVSCNIFAQLVEFNDGTVTVQRPTNPVQSIFGVGACSYPYNGYNMAIHAKAAMSSGNWTAGIWGEGNSTSVLNNGRSFGLYGVAGNSTSGYNYGVVGVRYGEQYGTGVYGSTANQIVYIPGVYAGYFNGDTYVDGDFTATSIITPSDIRLKKNIAPLCEMNSALDNVLSMNVISYNYKEREIPKAELDTIQANNLAEFTAKNTKMAKDVHFGLSAQELQEIYPNLVKEGQNGYLGVNYVELVPVLIRSIQELKEEIDALRDVSNISAQKYMSAICSDGATTIHFTLPDNTNTASISIYDLQGKMLKQIPVTSGINSVTAYSHELGNGVFLCSLSTNGREIETRRIVISK